MPLIGGISLLNGSMIGLTAISNHLNGGSYQRILGNQLSRHQITISPQASWMTLAIKLPISNIQLFSLEICLDFPWTCDNSRL